MHSCVSLCVGVCVRKKNNLEKRDADPPRLHVDLNERVQESILSRYRQHAQSPKP